MAKEQRSASERARHARAAAVVCAVAMLGAAAWLVWRHAVGTVVALDAERTLTLEVYVVAHAVSLFAAAQRARALSRPLSVQLAVAASARASINVIAAAFFALDVALAWALFSVSDGPTWVLAFLLPAVVTVWLAFSSFGVPPDEPEDISDEDLTEAALILTESQRRWSWEAVFAMAGYMAFTRAAILAAYLVCVAIGLAVFEWLSRALFESGPLTAEDLHLASALALQEGRDILMQGWTWIIFFLVAVAPPLFILSAAAWYRFQLRRGRLRLRPLSQSAAARLMTKGEILLLRRAVERPLTAKAISQRAVS